uniref:Uncharacterized protein n=1 Tax=Esox lucius TaxID=8010 RepID=A0AAY5L4M1_ESOLU
MVEFLTTLLGQHDQLIHKLLETNQQLCQQVAQLSSQIATLFLPSAPSSPPSQPASVAVDATPHAREPPVTSPEPFSGELNKCRGFLLQCGLVFQQRPLSFASEASKVHYTLGLLRGKALVPYDCAIELFPGAPLPASRLYNLSRLEREAMEKYI